MTSKPKRGGVRPGSGRPRKYADHVITGVSLDRSLLDQLDQWAKNNGLNRSQAVQKAIVEMIGGAI